MNFKPEEISELLTTKEVLIADLPEGKLFFYVEEVEDTVIVESFYHPYESMVAVVTDRTPVYKSEAPSEFLLSNGKLDHMKLANHFTTLMLKDTEIGNFLDVFTQYADQLTDEFFGNQEEVEAEKPNLQLIQGMLEDRDFLEPVHITKDELKKIPIEDFPMDTRAIIYDSIDRENDSAKMDGLFEIDLLREEEDSIDITFDFHFPKKFWDGKFGLSEYTSALLEVVKTYKGEDFYVHSEDFDHGDHVCLVFTKTIDIDEMEFEEMIEKVEEIKKKLEKQTDLKLLRRATEELLEMNSEGESAI